MLYILSLTGVFNIKKERIKAARAIKINDNRSKILKHIAKTPGVRYRELLRLTGLANGVLSYHLKILGESRSIKVNREGIKMTRYYPKNIKTKEFHVIAYTRNSTARQIIQLLLKQGHSTFKDIVKHTNKVPSTISWHLKRLENGKIISVSHKKLHVYRIKNKEKVGEIVAKYANI
jgi:predicted transcriptional regulator